MVSTVYLAQDPMFAVKFFVLSDTVQHFDFVFKSNLKTYLALLTTYLYLYKLTHICNLPKTLFVQVEEIIIIIILIKRCSLTRVKLTALYKHLITKTTLTYISYKQNLKYCSLQLLPIKQ